MTAEPLSRTSAVFLLVDHQTGVFERVVKAPPREQVEANMLRLARAAALLDMPVVFTTSEEKGSNGVLLPQLEELLPTAYANRIDRHGIIDSLADPHGPGSVWAGYGALPAQRCFRVRAPGAPETSIRAVRARSGGRPIASRRNARRSCCQRQGAPPFRQHEV